MGKLTGEVPGVKTGQHIGQLEVRIRMGSLVADIGEPEYTSCQGRAIAMPHPIDDKPTAGGGSSEA